VHRLKIIVPNLPVFIITVSHFACATLKIPVEAFAYIKLVKWGWDLFLFGLFLVRGLGVYN